MRRHGLNLLTTVLAMIGMSLLLYPTAASWVSQYHQSKVTEALMTISANAEPSAPEQLTQARRYNEALDSNALLSANERIATGRGELGEDDLGVRPYDSQLSPDSRGVMARLRIPSIDVDLPIYHGTSEETLLRGAGHLRGTSLPVGGQGTRTVITAHRGLANATMFTNLDRVAEGDRFVFEVMGEAFTYEVSNIEVIEPEETQSLLPQPGRDLATLVTCTPLGINSHRILVTGERVPPTPLVDMEAVGDTSPLPRFPWWLLIWGTAMVLGTAAMIRILLLIRRDRAAGPTTIVEKRKESTCY